MAPLEAAVEVIPPDVVDVAPEEVAPVEDLPPIEAPVEEEPAEEVEPFGWTTFSEEDLDLTVPGELGLEDVVEEAEELLPPPPTELPSAEVEPFGWTTFGAEEDVDLMQPDAGMAEEETIEAAPQVADSFGWTGFDEGAPPSVREVAEELPDIEIPPSEEPLPSEPVVTEPEMEVVEPEPEPAAEPAPEPEPVSVEPGDDIESLRAYVKENARDYGARLNLARMLLQSRRYDEAMGEYGRLVRYRKWADEVMSDMEGLLQDRPSDLTARRVLGDAYMRIGLLEEALKVYQDALEDI
jgi:hypothetical protein